MHTKTKLLVISLVGFLLLVIPIKNMIGLNSSLQTTLNPNGLISFDDDHYIEFMPEDGNLSGNCLSFGIEVKWSLHDISYDL